MDPVEIQGEVFSEYFLRTLMWQDRKLTSALDEAGARQGYRLASQVVRLGQRHLAERRAVRSTHSLLLMPFAELLGWRLGEERTVTTEEGDERAGFPLLAGNGTAIANLLALSPDVSMEAAPPGRHRRFAPVLSLVRVLEEQGLSYGLLLNGYRLRLVRRAEGFVASWVDFDLSAIAEGTDAGFEAWHTIWALLRQEAWAQTPAVLDQVVTLGRDHAARVSIGLGQQVQQAVVAFIQGLFSHPANQGKVENPPSRSQLDELYQQSLRILYRVLFTLYAEDRGLLPVDIPTYRDGYSLRRLSRWVRDAETDPRQNPTVGGRFVESGLRALFDLLRCGADLGPEGRIPMYGGGLFDPEQTTLVDSLEWGEATCADVIARMTWVPAGPRGQEVHLSYRELDVEQLGSVYESLLEQSVDYAAEPMWRIRLDDRFYVVTDAQRQDLAARRGEVMSSELEALLAAEEEEEEDEQPEPSDEPDEEDVDGEDAPRASRKPVRVLARIQPGTVFLRSGMGRKQTGSYYTNRAFVDFLVRRTVDPLAEGKTPEEILALKVVDPAMGSGHFLVGACRRLSEHLLAAYRELDAEEVPQEVTRVWQDEERALAACRLLVAGHCIYGVDKNPLAVDLARVSLWLATAAADHPLTFLDHRLRVGDSLLGMTADDLLRPWAPLPTKSKQATKKSHSIFPLVGRPLALEELYEGAGRQLRERLRRAFTSLETIHRLFADQPENLSAHRLAHEAMLGELRPFWELHELRLGFAFVDHPDSEIINEWLRDLGTLGFIDQAARARGATAWQAGRGLGAFCWDLAFPDVWFDEKGHPKESGGFDVVVGNPPWEKIKPHRKEFYAQWDPAIRDLQGSSLKARISAITTSVPGATASYARHAQGQRAYAEALLSGGMYSHQRCKVRGKATGGDPDLFRFFTERAHVILSKAGRAGLLLPSALLASESCTALRKLIIGRGRVDVICRFDNERRLFPGTDHRYRFVLFVFREEGARRSFPIYFLNWETADVLLRLQGDRRRVEFSLDDLDVLSPESLAVLDVSSSLGVRTATRLHTVLGAAGESTTALHGSFATEFHMTQDSSLFRTREWLDANACENAGDEWRAKPRAWYLEHGFAAREDGFLLPEDAGAEDAQPVLPGEAYVPLFEGRMVHQFDYAAKAYVSGEAGNSVWQELPFRSGKALAPHYYVAYSDFLRLAPGRNVYRCAFCDVSSQTNERTLLATVIPGSAAAGNKVPTVVVQEDGGPRALLWAAVANSFCADWLMRLRSAGTLNFFLFAELPSPAVSRNDPRLPRLVLNAARLTCFTRHMSDLWNDVARHYPHELETPWRPELAPTDLRERARLRVEIEVMVTDLYGLSVQEFAYILTTFPLLDRGQPALAGDVFIRQTNKGERITPRSYITRDTALLEYCRYKGVAPPDDIVAFCAGIDVDISRQTGIIRNLEERVAEATRLGATAYVPTPTRRKE